MKKLLVLILVAGALSGCAYNAQTVTLNPTIESPHTVQGQGVTVAFKVIDDRVSTSLGHRGAAFTKAAEITTNSDLKAVVADRVTRALAEQGFTILEPTGHGDANLLVEIRLLKYSTSTGFWTGGVQVQATLEATANKGDRTYRNIYRAKREERVVFVPTAETNSKWINETLEKVITELVNDSELIQFLAS